MRKHRWSTNNGLSRKKLPKHTCSPAQGVFGTPPAKTGPIIALYCIFSRHLVSEYPSQIRWIRGGPDESQNESFFRRRPRGHVKSCSRTVSSYGGAGWLRPLLRRNPWAIARVASSLFPCAQIPGKTFSQDPFLARRMEYSSHICPKAGKVRRKKTTTLAIPTRPQPLPRN